MTSERTFLAVMAAIAGTVGYFTRSRYLKYELDKRSAEQDKVALAEHEATKRRLANSIDLLLRVNTDKQLQQAVKGNHLLLLSTIGPASGNGPEAGVFFAKIFFIFYIDIT